MKPQTAQSQPTGSRLPMRPSIPRSRTACSSTKAASIAVFFYNGPNSRAIAFEGLLNSGENFGRRLLGGLRYQGPAQPATSPALPRRHRRRKLRPPPSPRRDGALLRHALDRRQEARPAHQLRRVPAKFPPRMGGRGGRRYLLELRPWHRTLALRLRLQRRQSGLEPALARTPARCARLPPRRLCSALANLSPRLCSRISGRPATRISTSCSTARPPSRTPSFGARHPSAQPARAHHRASS